MLPSLSRGLRIALVASLSLGYIAARGHSQPAFADDDEDGGGGDDSEDAGDDGGKGDSGGEDGDGEDQEDAKDQPPVTAGGLYTLGTYPVSEILRPLTMTQGITQLRLGLGTDLSAKGAFNTYGVSLEGVHGLSDNFSLIGGITDAYNFKQFGVYFGFEGALAYDVVDIRLAANIHRFGIPKFEDFSDAKDGSLILPNGNYSAGKTQFSVDLGFPFRYAAKPEIAIIALQTLITFDFNSGEVDIPDGMGGSFKSGNKVKPDLNPSLGVETNPIPQLSLVIFTQLRIPDFDTSKGNFQVPATVRAQFSPNQKFDIGLEFTFVNMKPPDPQKFYDNRFLNLFVQTRLGK